MFEIIIFIVLFVAIRILMYIYKEEDNNENRRGLFKIDSFVNLDSFVNTESFNDDDEISYDVLKKCKKAEYNINLGLVYLENYNFEKAEILFKDALVLLGRSIGYINDRTALIMYKLGWIYFSRNDFRHAEVLYKKALKILNQLENVENFKYILLLNNLLGVYIERNKYENFDNYMEYEKFLKRLLSLVEEELNNKNYRILDNDYGILYVMVTIATYYRHSGRILQAQEIENRIYETLNEGENNKLGDFRLN